MLHKPTQLDPYRHYQELTLRGVILGVLITIVFTASNIYLGLKVGLTFASSIPAAVLSMALLKFAQGSNILENNLVQTQASAAGTLSSVIFVLPGLLMLGYWQSFPFWQIALLCLSGGVLGVLFTIPLRQVMVVNSELPYPEGVAAAEILKAGTVGVVANEKGDIVRDENSSQQSHAKEIVYGGVLAASMSLLSGGLRIVSDSASIWLKAGGAIFQIPFGFSFALLGAGSLIGLSAGIAIFLGIFFAWGFAVPYFTAILPQPEHVEIAQYAKQIWSSKVRFIGVGVIGIASIWTLISLFKPMVEGIKLSIASYQQTQQHHNTQRAARDLSPKHMLIILAVVMAILFATFYQFIALAPVSTSVAWLLVVVVTVLTFLIGFLVAAACGYMAGLVGSSSSPISGIGILSVLFIALVLLVIGQSTHLLDQPSGIQFLTALTLFATSAVLAVATISNDNLQDLKTGYLVYATPAKQQIALIIGCIVGALVIAPVIQLLYQAYGFTGALPRSGMDEALVLAAPQATLMSTIAQGIFSHQLAWDSILIGAGLGVIFILIDVVLKRSSAQKYSLPVLAVGMGIYLPPSVNVPIFIGAVLFALVQRAAKKKQVNEQGLKHIEQKSTLFAAGLIVGESLMGVILALIIVVSTSTGGSDSPLQVTLFHSEVIADVLGGAFFILVMAIYAQRVLKTSSS